MISNIGWEALKSYVPKIGENVSASLYLCANFCPCAFTSTSLYFPIQSVYIATFLRCTSSWVNSQFRAEVLHKWYFLLLCGQNRKKKTVPFEQVTAVISFLFSNELFLVFHFASFLSALLPLHFLIIVKLKWLQHFHMQRAAFCPLDFMLFFFAHHWLSRRNENFICIF